MSNSPFWPDDPDSTFGGVFDGARDEPYVDHRGSVRWIADGAICLYRAHDGADVHELLSDARSARHGLRRACVALPEIQRAA